MEVTSLTDYELERLWSVYTKKNEIEVRKKLLDLFETTKKQASEKYIQDIGKSLDKLAPVNSTKKSNEAKFFWNIANEWDPNIEKTIKNHLNQMKNIFE